jgi:hypothetical protein
MKNERLADGRERIVRHGHGPERQVQTGIGPVTVRRAKLRDRGVDEAGADRIRFTSAILPRWARRTRSLDALLPILYLRGVSMGDFQEALGALLGKDAPNLSPSVIARLRGEWEADYARWQRRDLSARHYVYVWADGVYLQTRMEPQAECPTTKASRGHAGADRRHAGRQEGVARLPSGRSWSRFRSRSEWNTSGGVRESTQSWRELLVDLKARGLTIAPELATGDGALGFWKALDAVSPTTQHQRCTVHTIRTQSRGFRRRWAVAARRWGTQWDNMADRQTAFADDDAVDHQLQDGLLLRQGGIGQAAADAIAERRHVGPHRLGLEPLLA